MNVNGLDIKNIAYAKSSGGGSDGYYRERVLWDMQELTGIDDADNMLELFSCIENTPNMPASAIITGIINFGTLPPGLSRGELVIHKIPNSYNFEYAAELSSTDIAPYRWYWKGNAWIPYIYTSYSTSSLSTINIGNLKDGEIYNYTGALTTLVIANVSQTVRGGESVIYFTTGDTIQFSYPDNMKTTGETSLQPNTEYMITVRNSIMTVTAIGLVESEEPDNPNPPVTPPPSETEDVVDAQIMRAMVNSYGIASADNEDMDGFRWVEYKQDGSIVEHIAYVENDETLTSENEISTAFVYEDEETSLSVDSANQHNRYDVFNHPVPDKYNVGHISPREDLVSFDEKYPDCVLSDGRYVITETNGNTYNHTFTGFYSDRTITCTNCTTNVVLDDFYIYTDEYDTGKIVNNYLSNADDFTMFIQNGEMEGGIIRAYNMVVRNIYMHNGIGDFINILNNTKIINCYFHDAGIEPTAHADGFQIAGYDSKNAWNIYIDNVRIDMPVLPNHVANACLMIQPDYGAVNQVYTNRCKFNGGGYSVYAFPKKNTVDGVVLNDTELGYGARFGLYYEDSQDNMTENNTQMYAHPKIGTIELTSNNLKYYMSNYITDECTVDGEITFLNNGNIVGTQSFSHDIRAYVPYETYNNEYDPNEPMNEEYNVAISETGYDAIKVKFMHDGAFVGGYYICL